MPIEDVGDVSRSNGSSAAPDDSERLQLTKRDFLRTTAGSAALAAGPGSAVAGAGVSSTDREPTETTIRQIDGTDVVFQYGRPLPSFETWHQDNPDRDYVDCNGTWKFRFGDGGEDPDEIGEKAGWYRREYDDADWDEVRVPLPWDLYDSPGFDTYGSEYYGEGTAYRDGYAWYRKRIQVPESWEDAYVKLTFLAAFYSARVYVNGERVGEHEGGHTPFSLDVGEALRPGEENLLAVRVYRREWFEDELTSDDPTAITAETEVPDGSFDWWPYAGLTRDVYLEATSQVTVSKLLVDAVDDEAALRAVVYNHGDHTATRTVMLSSGEGTGGQSVSREVTIEPGGTRVVEASVSIPNGSEWSVESPTTYEATASLSDGDNTLDQLSARYGVRSVSIEDGVLHVNGERVFLRGFNWHEETGANGRSMSRDEYDQHFRRVESADANFLRNSHYNRHPYFYEYADENGLFVMDETDNMWMGEEAQERQLDYGLSRALTVTTAWNQYNRPSVIMWCLQNESDPEARETHLEWLEDMKSGVETVDDQDRPVMWSSYEWGPRLNELTDVIGYNEYFGYFWGENEELGPELDRMAASNPDTPILITENGTWSRADQRGGDPGDPHETGTEAWQARNFAEHWVQVVGEDRPEQVQGYTYWLLKDYKQRDGYNQDVNAVSTMGTMNWGDPELETFYVYDVIAAAYGAYSGPFPTEIRELTQMDRSGSDDAEADDLDVDWIDAGDEVAFTVTPALAEELAAYGCGIHESMTGAIETVASDEDDSMIDDEVVVYLDAVGTDAWEVAGIEGAPIVAVTEAGENPRLTLHEATRYVFTDLPGSDHPLEFRDSDGEVVLGQEVEGATDDVSDTSGDRSTDVTEGGTLPGFGHLTALAGMGAATAAALHRMIHDEEDE